MGYSSLSGRARTDPRNPSAFGVCDLCGMWYNLRTLQYQYAWAGTNLINTQSLRCSRCLDVPNEQFRTIVIPPDPLPVLNARTENFAVDEATPTSATLTAAASQGDTVIFLDSIAGFSDGDTIFIQLNNGTYMENTISSVNETSDAFLLFAALGEVGIGQLSDGPGANSFTLSIPLTYSAPSGGLVSLAA